MYTVIFLLTYQVASQALATSEVTKDLAMHWNTENVSKRKPYGKDAIFCTKFGLINYVFKRRA